MDKKVVAIGCVPAELFDENGVLKVDFKEAIKVRCGEITVPNYRGLAKDLPDIGGPTIEGMQDRKSDRAINPGRDDFKSSEELEEQDLSMAEEEDELITSTKANDRDIDIEER